MGPARGTWGADRYKHRRQATRASTEACRSGRRTLIRSVGATPSLHRLSIPCPKSIYDAAVLGRCSPVVVRWPCWPAPPHPPPPAPHPTLPSPSSDRRYAPPSATDSSSGNTPPSYAAAAAAISAAASSPKPRPQNPSSNRCSLRISGNAVRLQVHGRTWHVGSKGRLPTAQRPLASTFSSCSLWHAARALHCCPMGVATPGLHLLPLQRP